VKRCAVVVVSLVALVAGGSALAARVHLVVAPAIVVPGSAVRVVASSSPCHVGGMAVAISAAFPGDAFGGAGTLSGRVARGGAFSIGGHVRSHVKPGRYTVGVRCGGGNLGVTAYLRVR
jgi:hypothetical protein